MNLLEVRNLKVHFPVRDGPFRRRMQFVRAVDSVSLTLSHGQTVGLVGESGCGKTTLGRAVIRLIEPTSGRVLFEGQDITGLTGAILRSHRRKFQMIFQDPFSSLDPRMRVEEIIGKALDIHQFTPNGASRRQRVAELLQQVGLDPSHAGRYPHEFSGGQRQRIGIARALAVEPQLVVCDEPVSALDVSVQAQIVNLLTDLQRAHRIAYLFIAHDLAVVRHLSRRILVMYLGKIVESGDARAVCDSPLHPYTQALISAVPVIDPNSKQRRIVLAGEAPSPLNPPDGCAFHPRCHYAQARCRSEVPPLQKLANGREVACHRATR